MENLVPLGTGNSRLMKSNIPSNTTLAQLIQMWNNGTFPYDIGPLNSAGISQQGTPLNKATLLKDATAALFGFGGDALPDDMFNALAHTGDLHVWKRTQNGQVDYPVSPNRNAYQEGTSGTTTIEYMGQLGNKARIETGSYVGTGTYGQSNPNSLTFGFVPKLWGILGDYTNNSFSVTPFLAPYGITSVYGAYLAGGTTSTTIKVSYSGNTISWYTEVFSGAEQFNRLNSVYYYVALG